MQNIMRNSEKKYGRVCFTFDDRNFRSWNDSLPLFQKYDAHATFFVSGEMDGIALDCMKNLQDSGHSIGLHALHHTRYFSAPENYIETEIIPQKECCDRAGIDIRAFAYPFSQRDEASDCKLFEIFDFLRGGAWQVACEAASLADNERLFVADIAPKQLFFGIAASGNFDFHEISRCLFRAAEQDETVVFYAHDITGKVAPRNHISSGQLEVLLKLARALDMNICGINEL